MLLEYQLRIRNAANSANALTVTSVRGGTNPYLSSVPSGDAATIDPRTGKSSFGVYSGRLIDVVTGGSPSQRLLTALLEDSGARQQLGFRVAILEFREDGGSWRVMIAGYLTGLRLVSGMEYEYTITDPMHAQILTRMFSPTSDTLITDFLADWPIRGCVLGGPVIGASGPVGFGIADLGGWEMRVETTGIATEYFLRPRTIYGPPDWTSEKKDQKHLELIASTVNDAVGAVQMPLFNGKASPWDTIGDAEENGWAWRGLTILIDGVPWKPLAPDYDSYVDSEGYAHKVPRLFNAGYNGQDRLKVKSDGVKTLTNGQIVRVRALTVLPTEISPIYISDHPIEILKSFWTSAGFAFSAADCTAMKELIGTDARYGLKITSARNLRDLVENICFAWGIGLRGNDSGEIVPFDARLGRSSTTPAVTIGSADVDQNEPIVAYDLKPDDAINLITFRMKRFADQRSVQGKRGDATIVDGVAVSEEELTVINDESGSPGIGEMEIVCDGMMHGTWSLYPTVRAFWIAIARRIFDRWGRGGIGASMTLLRNGAGGSVQLGDEILVNLPQIPNANYRLGDNGSIAARAMQIVRRTVVPKGFQVALVDSGLSGQPPATLPTLSIASSSDLPLTVAEVTITNAAALNAAGIGVRLQIAYAATSTRFTDVAAYTPGNVPTTAIRLPAVVADTEVHVRARSEAPGRRPSNWTASVNVALAALTAPSGLTATPDAGDGSRCTLEWTIGEATAFVDVLLVLDGVSFDQAVQIQTLEPGSTRYELTGLEPGTDYIALVRHRAPTTQDTSDADFEGFTTSGSSVTLDPPTDPCPFTFMPFSGRLLGQSTIKTGVYGLAVVAAEVPGEIEVYQAVETSVGAGTYGSFAKVGTVVAVSDNWTLWEAIAPNDGLRRQLKARHVADGKTASSYTAIVVATPWTRQPLSPYPGGALLELAVTPISPSASDRLAFRLTPRDPFPSGSADLDLAFDIESGLTVYEYGTTTPASAVSVASGSNNDYEAIRPEATSGPKTVSATVTRAGRTTGPSAIIVVPEKSSTTLPSVPSITAIRTSNLNAPDPPDGGGSFDIDFDAVNMPAGTTFDLDFEITAGTVGGGPFNDTRTGISNPDTIDCASVGGLDGSAVPAAKLVLKAKVLGNTIAIGVYDSTLNP